MEVLQIPSELDQMLALYKKKNPRRVLEIGCWDGGTLQHWLAVCPDVVVAIDPDHRNPDAYPDWVLPGTDLIIGHGKSQDEDMVSLMQEWAPYDWVFIDGDHSVPAVAMDVHNTTQLIAKGGVMLLHDITQTETAADETGPMREYKRLLETHRGETFECGDRFPWTAGIGVIYF